MTFPAGTFLCQNQAVVCLIATVIEEAVMWSNDEDFGFAFNAFSKVKCILGFRVRVRVSWI